MNQNGGNDGKIKRVQPQPSNLQGANIDKNYKSWNFGCINIPDKK